MACPVKVAPHGSWGSQLTPKKRTEGAVSFAELNSSGDSLFWLERRPQESGRTAIVRHCDGKTVDVLSREFSASTSVHEYGGGAYCVDEDTIWFVNQSDQNIYSVEYRKPDSVKQVTHTDRTERFADLTPGATGQYIYCVRETHAEGTEPRNEIVRLGVTTGDVEVIVSDHDFVSDPRPNADETQLAYVAWDHPNMPWDGTQLILHSLLADSADQTVLAGGRDISVVQPRWLADSLYYASDESGFWNLYRYDESGIEQLVGEDAEYASAPWAFGFRSFVPLNERFTIASRIEATSRDLVMVDGTLHLTTPLLDDFSSCSNLTPYRGQLAYIEGRSNASSRIVLFDYQAQARSIVKEQTGFVLSPEDISIPEKISYSNAHDQEVYAYLYLPRNASFTGPRNVRPPLLVKSHGGPTSSTRADYSNGIQFYTNRGWAVLDVDYGGSTGYGRAYRDRLQDNWGVTDVEDCVAGVRHLIAQDIVDPAKIAITGGSAGGYTTLQALTTSTVFGAGASHYGIGDVRTLAQDTHKFESRYCDSLIPESEWSTRSPLDHTEDLACPVVFFQGLDDAVVRPAQSRSMFDALDEKGLTTALFLFEGEGHGFRKADNIETTEAAQYKFFAQVFGFETPGITASIFSKATVANAPWV